jgi:glyoxylase-like metal-dependent hydrolase (beta-lactamase superfamily II)
MKLIPLPAFQDNYLWVLHDGQRALVVDPGDAQPVRAFLQGEGLQLDTILVTPHHPDHVDGVDELHDATGAKVFGPARRTHEYTLSDLKFARAVEPGNLKLINYQQRCEELRARNLPTLPSPIEQERDINPFLRTRLPAVAQAASTDDAATPPDDVAVFAAIRKWKNEFK